MTRFSRVLTAIAGVASAVVVAAVASEPAEARRGYGWHGGVRHHHTTRTVYFRPAYRPYRPVYFYRPAYVAPVYYRGYSDCGWLKRRAFHTGSPYWWQRYRACIGY